jgi:ureidoglycolate lyase
MQTMREEELEVEGFLPFGYYMQLIDPDAEKFGAPLREFFRDMLQLNLGSSMMVSFSICRVKKRALLIEAMEYHAFTGEGILPLDKESIIPVGPASRPDTFPGEKIRAFRIPQGTMVVLRPGTWHHAPFTVNDVPANVLIILPERTSANDCTVENPPDAEYIRIEL